MLLIIFMKSLKYFLLLLCHIINEDKAACKNYQINQLKPFYISFWSSLYFWQQIYPANNVLLMLKLTLIGISCEQTEWKQECLPEVKNWPWIIQNSYLLWVELLWFHTHDFIYLNVLVSKSTSHLQPISVAMECSSNFTYILMCIVWIHYLSGHFYLCSWSLHILKLDLPPSQLPTTKFGSHSIPLILTLHISLD